MFTHPLSELTIAFWTLVFTVGGVVAGIAAFIIAWLTIRDNSKIAKAQFWIMLRGVFTQYDDIHCDFRPGGKWADPKVEPETALEMGRIELYMGLFEYCDRLLEGELIDLQEFSYSYKYRLRNLVGNEWVCTAKLSDHRKDWQFLISLCSRLNVSIPTVPPLSADERSSLYPKR